MSQNKDLKKLRKEIDRIDEAIHDLLIARFETSEKIGVMKGSDAVYFRPAREAELLKNLVNRHRGRLPAAVLVRLWREILSSSTALQGDFGVSAFGKGSNQSCRILAEDHFSRQAVSSGGTTVKTVLRAVSTGKTAVGVLPFPGSDDKAGEDWWTLILPRHSQERGENLQVIGRLPFCTTQAALDQRQGAIMVAATPVEPTGDDHSFLVLEAPEKLSRSALQSMMNNSDLHRPLILGESCHAGRFLYLCEVAGFFSPDDERLNSFVARNRDRVIQIVSIGAFARPILCDE